MKAEQEWLVSLIQPEKIKHSTPSSAFSHKLKLHCLHTSSSLCALLTGESQAGKHKSHLQTQILDAKILRSKEREGPQSRKGK